MGEITGFGVSPILKHTLCVGWILGVANVFTMFAFNEYARFRANARLGWRGSPVSVYPPSQSVGFWGNLLGSGGICWVLGVANMFTVFASNEYARFRANARLGRGDHRFRCIPSPKTRLRVGCVGGDELARRVRA
jgi:hypothetical protein